MYLDLDELDTKFLDRSIFMAYRYSNQNTQSLIQGHETFTINWRLATHCNIKFNVHQQRTMHSAPHPLSLSKMIRRMTPGLNLTRWKELRDRNRESYSKECRHPAKTPGKIYRQMKNHKDIKHSAMRRRGH